MDASYRTPVWLTGLLAVIFIIFASIFGSLLFMHAKKSALEERLQGLRAEVINLRAQDGELQTAIGVDGPLARQCQKRVALLKELDEETKTSHSDSKTMLEKAATNAIAIHDSLDKATATRKTLDQEVKDRRLEIALVEPQLLANERDFDARRLRLRDQIAVATTETEEVRKKSLKENLDKDRRITELNDRIAELTRQREIANQDVKADGVIMEADATVGFVVVDLGRNQALRKGTRFTVFNRRAGRNVYKGIIEVTNVEAGISTCRVVEEKDPNNPLIPNDLISNPVFDRAKVKAFAIRGSFVRFSKDELKNFIVESGGRYNEDLSVATDYLVAGDNAESYLLDANKLGITILSEEQLIESQLFRLTTAPKN